MTWDSKLSNKRPKIVNPIGVHPSVDRGLSMPVLDSDDYQILDNNGDVINATRV